MRNTIKWLMAALTLTACTSIDCPLDHTVEAKYKIMGDGAFTDTLYVATQRTDGIDSVLLNRLTATDSFYLPMSYAHEEDVYYYLLSDTLGHSTIDTVWISKTNQPHFTSIDCSASFFHTLTGVRNTRHAIDHIQIINKEVTYDATKTNIQIYLKNRM